MKATYTDEFIFHCYCDKGNATLYFSFEPEGEWSVDCVDANFLYDGFSEYYWENHYEFEPSVSILHSILSTNKEFPFNDAVIETFGHFHLGMTLNGTAITLPTIVNADEIMQEILLTDC